MPNGFFVSCSVWGVWRMTASQLPSILVLFYRSFFFLSVLPFWIWLVTVLTARPDRFLKTTGRLNQFYRNLTGLKWCRTRSILLATSSVPTASEWLFRAVWLQPSKRYCISFSIFLCCFGTFNLKEFIGSPWVDHLEKLQHKHKNVLEKFRTFHQGARMR